MSEFFEGLKNGLEQALQVTESSPKIVSKRIMVQIAPCPWCQKTGSFNLCASDETWLPKVLCDSMNCDVNPRGKYVPIRNTAKKCPIKIREKIALAVDHWNENNPLAAYECTLIDMTQIYDTMPEYGPAMPEFMDIRFIQKFLNPAYNEKNT